MTRPIGIDLFAGAGGMSLGFEQAGFDVVAAVEIDPIHAAVHSFNFPECAVLARSVVGLRGEEIREAANIGQRTVDVVFGGPPCQGFSLIGQRALDDPRNLLVREFVRIVKELDANYFVFENVKGLTVGRHAQILRDLIDEFASIGYEVVKPWKVLNAAEYGVPQSRERLFLVGGKKGLPPAAYPNPTSWIAGRKVTDSRLPSSPTCREALQDIPDAELYPELLKADVAAVELTDPSPYASILRGITRNINDFSCRRKWDHTKLTSSLRTEHTSESRERFALCQQGFVERVSRFFKLPADGVANTLRAGTDSARGAFTSPRPIHYEHPRCVTVREMMRLHGYPDWFRMHATKWHGARQVGNSVPPPLAKAVAGQIVSSLRIEPSMPSRAIELGNPSLLHMDMREASDYFSISVPIRSRVRRGQVL